MRPEPARLGGGARAPPRDRQGHGLTLPDGKGDNKKRAGNEARSGSQQTRGDVMKRLAIMRPVEGVDVCAGVAAHAGAELRALWDLSRRGTVREMYSPGGPAAVLLLEASSAEDAWSSLSNLPLYAARIMDAELIELQPFAALQILFSEESPA
jgi:hypothetical protein